MGINLKKHNEKAYQKIKDMLKETDRAAVVHPTGTGKTYIALKWIEETSGKTIYVAPSNHILSQVKEDVEKAKESGEISDEQYKRYKEVKYVTYTSLMELSKMESGYDNIIIDEFHRCGAPEWSKGVDRIIKQSPNAKILGMTATPIRAVDNKDMADAIFKGNVASEMTLEEAVAEGIIEAPIYINGIYSLQEEIKKAESNIEKISNEETKKELRKDIEEAKRHLEQAEGLDDIFAKYAGDKKEGKYIVFCNDINDMHKKMQESNKWFEKVGETRIYEVSYRKSDKLNEDTIKRFKEEGEKINLLFSVDKLNEGVHVDGIDGVIMLRKTGSPIVYTQQLGRALSVGNEGTPIVFDLVNNIDSSEYIYEFMERVQKIRQERGLDEKDIGNFKIFDIQRDVKEILEKITEKLGRTSYLEKIYEIKEWMERNETTRPPRGGGKDLPEEERKLGRVLGTIRQNLIKPYKELKTEEEREKYRKRRPEIEEIMKIVEEIDKNNIPAYLKNIRDIKEWMKRNETTIPPRCKVEDISKEEGLGTALSNIRCSLIKPYKELKTEEEREEYIGKLEDWKQEPISREQFMEIIEKVEEIDKNNIPAYLKNIRNIKEWMKKNDTTIPPSCTRKELPEEEKRLGKSLEGMRHRIIKPYKELKTEEEREEYISNLENKKIESLSRDQFMEIIETVEEIDKNNIPAYLKNIRDIKEWMKRNETTIPPSTVGKNISEEEKRLGRALSNIKSRLIKPYKELKTEEEREEYISKLENRKRESLSREQFIEIIETIEGIDRNNIPTGLRNIRKIKKWMERNETTIPPRSGGKDLPEEEKGLGVALSGIRQELINPYKKLKTKEEREDYISKLENREKESISRDQLMEIIKTVEEIDKNNIPTRLRNIRDIKEWMERNETTIPPRKKGEEISEEEKRLGVALLDIRYSLIKPYKELKSEEEREEYIGKLEDKEREPLSRKQFMEIIETIEEIDGDREKLTDLVEQSKATQEKVAEAKKLESMYEQELKSKEQKEGFDIQDSDN